MTSRKRTESLEAYRLRSAAMKRANRATYRERGRCAWCTRPALPGRWLCRTCADKAAHAQAERRAGKPLPFAPVRRPYYIERIPEEEDPC